MLNNNFIKSVLAMVPVATLAMACESGSENTCYICEAEIEGYKEGGLTIPIGEEYTLVLEYEKALNSDLVYTTIQ